MKILIVDDDKMSLEAVRLVLGQEGHEILTAQNGLEAMEIIRSGDCRMVISDWMMPWMNGLELCRQIRSEPASGYVYIIILTSREGFKNAVQGLSAGADDFISKPFHPEELLWRVRSGERILSLETRDVAIFAMAKLAESRDPDTGSHLERVRNYSRILAEYASKHSAERKTLPADFVQLVYLTSPLHDIGKVGIPDCVLLKPGRLSDAEFEIMKTHTSIGATMLNAAVRQYPMIPYLQLARDIALTHHERWDGTGYPCRLAGNTIPMGGRIVALADVYDALTSKRVYKKAFTHEIARSTILAESGKQFDPELVKGFVECEERFIAIREMLRDDALMPVPELAGV